MRNLFVVWFLTGFWHGASWNFVLWGLYFGLLILLERLFLARFLDAIPRFFSHAYLTLAMLLGWVFFYFTDLSEAVRCLQILFGLGGRPLSSMELILYFNQNIFIYAIAIVGSTPLAKWVLSRMAEQPFLTRLRWADFMVPIYNFGLFSVSTILLVGSTYNPFLYFRF